MHIRNAFQSKSEQSPRRFECLCFLRQSAALSSKHGHVHHFAGGSEGLWRNPPRGAGFILQLYIFSCLPSVNAIAGWSELASVA